MENKQPLIVFYTSVPRLFRTTFIGNLYEICQKYPTILLSEKLDVQTERVLLNKNLFPKLIKIIPVYQFTGPKQSMFSKNRYLYKMAKDIISRYRPDVVIVENDIYPFELYLLRLAKKIGSLTIAMQASLKGPVDKVKLYYTLSRAYERMPHFLPLIVRVLLVKLQRILGHWLVYWVFPLLVGEPPFLGETSYIKWNLTIGQRDIDYYAVFSKKEYNLFIKENVPKEKLLILSHPLTRKTKRFFKTAYLFDIPKNKTGRKIITLMWPDSTVGFRNNDYSPIVGEEFLQSRMAIIKIISDFLPEWDINIKPHPQVENVQEIRKQVKSISPHIKVADPSEPADKYIEMSNVILAPPPASTVLFIAAFQNPKKIILSLDLYKELQGDFYKDFPNVDYIDSKEKFIEVLKAIKNNKYQKKIELSLKPEGFKDTNEMLEYIFQQKDKNRAKE